MQEPHHGQLGQVFVENAAGSRHPRSAVANALAVGPPALELADEVCAMQVAAGFTDGEKDFHR
jgi:hypothetical protein